jgi:transcriptional regulator with XRE-family HTH domain
MAWSWMQIIICYMFLLQTFAKWGLTSGLLLVDLPNRELLYQEFGIALANERRRQHLSQAQFGAKVGLSRTSVTNIECGRQPIQLHQLYHFASTLRVDVTRLLPKESALAEVAAQKPDDKQVRYLAEAAKALSRADKRSVEGDDGR